MAQTSQQDIPATLCFSNQAHSADLGGVSERCLTDEIRRYSCTRVRRGSVKSADGAVFAGISSIGGRRGVGQSNTDYLRQGGYVMPGRLSVCLSVCLSDSNFARKKTIERIFVKILPRM